MTGEPAAGMELLADAGIAVAGIAVVLLLAWVAWAMDRASERAEQRQELAERERRHA